jgi:TRAP-type C4-dicarboxylate transport system permease small subunit
METTMKVIMGLLVAMMVGIFFILVDMIAGSQSPPTTATVIERIYTPSSTSTGVGTGVTSSGKVGTVVMTSSEPEKWTVIVNVGGNVVAAKANATAWSAAMAGRKASVAYWRGWITRWNYGWIYLG